MAERTKRFAAGVSTAYAAIATNILYSLASVPLALKYLGKTEFGLWALAAQISGYLMLLDFGVSSANTRLLADYKDDVNGGEYGSYLLTGMLIFVVQGVLIAIVGMVISIFAPALFSIPPRLHESFRNVLIIISVLAGVSVSLRVIGSPLWSFQRMDVINISAIATLFVTFPALWLGFYLGWGIYSLPVAGIPALFARITYEMSICWKNGYYPSRENWGRPSRKIFNRLFGFGKDVLLMSLGSQLVNATQIMIVSRFAGLDTAASFSIGTKFYSMGQQLVSKLMESSTPGLTEVFIHGDFKRLRRRFWDIISITAFMAVLGATMLVFANSSVITVWTSKIIHWTLTADLLLGGLLIATSLSKCFVALFGVTGSYGPIRHIYLVEGCVFLLLAIPAVRMFGINGVLTATLLAHLSVTGVLSVRASLQHLQHVQRIFSYFFVSSLILLSSYLTALACQRCGISLIEKLVSAPILGIFFAWLCWVWLVEDPLKAEVGKKMLSFIKKKH